MKTFGRIGGGGRLLPLLASTALAVAGCAGVARGDEESARLEALKREGREASITLLPVGLGGKPAEPVAEALGMYLERCGMTNLEVGAVAFRPSADAGLDETAAALREHLAKNPVSTGYALYADFRGTPGRGVDEVRALIVDRSGQPVWQDSQTEKDADFRRVAPREPLQCVVLLAERMEPLLSLGDPATTGAPEGKISRRWAERTGLPSQEERQAMVKRAEALRKAAAGTNLRVAPVLIGDRPSAADGAELAKAIGGAGLARASAAGDAPRFAPEPTMNEQKVLWDFARAFRQQVRDAKPDADYSIGAHYLLMGPERVGAVHFVVCDRAGEWVLVDYQNDHHADFRDIAPRNAADCARLVVRRLEGSMK